MDCKYNTKYSFLNRQNNKYISICYWFIRVNEMYKNLLKKYLQLIFIINNKYKKVFYIIFS